MDEPSKEPYSYRADPAVPDFDDAHPLIVFDGVCVLCNGWADFILRHDRKGRFRLTTAQGALGEALFRHYGLVEDGKYRSALLLRDGRGYLEMDTPLTVFAELGWPWRALSVLRAVPRGVRGPAYRLVARNRYRWFGRRTTCRIPSADERERFL